MDCCNRYPDFAVDPRTWICLFPESILAATDLAELASTLAAFPCVLAGCLLYRQWNLAPLAY
jgi:hypothetical protein